MDFRDNREKAELNKLDTIKKNKQSSERRDSVVRTRACV